MKLNNLYLYLFLIGFAFLNFSQGPPTGHTGAPGDNVCTNCHTPPSPNDPDAVGFGSISFSNVPTDISPNTTYPIEISLSNFSPNGRSAGFQLVALDGNTETSSSIGTFSDLGANIEETTKNNRTYVHHFGDPNSTEDNGEFTFAQVGNPIRYSFSWTAPAELNTPVHFYAAGLIANGGGSSGDFVETVSATNSTLPVELLNFQLKTTAENQVSISWETASESNSKHFEILRSANGKDYLPIQEIAAAGFSTAKKTYSFTDSKPILNQTSFYRLKPIDLDGKFTYAPIKSIEVLQFEQNTSKIFPNPLQRGECLFVEFLAQKNYPTAEIQIYDVQGKKTVMDSQLLEGGLREGFNKIVLDTGNLSEGIYFLQIEDRQQILGRHSFVFAY